MPNVYRDILRNKISAITTISTTTYPKKTQNILASHKFQESFLSAPKRFQKPYYPKSKLPNPVPDESFFRIQNLKQRFTFGKIHSENHIWILDTENQENSEPSKEMKQQSEESDVLDLMDTDGDLDMASDFGQKEEEWREEKRKMEEEMERMAQEMKRTVEEKRKAESERSNLKGKIEI